jgi:peptidoglycan L-alanyl-D-glutamate endopeptidase CwlK
MLISRDLSLVFAPFAEQLRDFEARLAAAKLPFYLYMALRTFEDQDELYAQGRTKPGSIVTNARGGDSLHNYGLAADYVLDGMPAKPGVQWSWDTKFDSNQNGRSGWMDLGAIARAAGLEWGGDWKRFPDLPHVQNRYGLTLAEIKELYRSCRNDLKAFWAALKEHV